MVVKLGDLVVEVITTCRVSNLLIWTCVASCDEFCILEKLWVAFFQIWALIHALATRGRKEGGEKMHCIPVTYSNSQGGACAFLLHFWLLGVCSSVCNRPDRFVPSVGTCSGGACICVGGALVCFGGLCSLLDHGFVSDVSSRCPCLKGQRRGFFK
jgi:hypothetical protein